MQRDVPGFTRAALPILYAQGVRAVTVGVNGGSAPPGVPHNQPFIWRDTQSQTDMLAMWHPGASPIQQHVMLCMHYPSPIAQIEIQIPAICLSSLQKVN